METTLQYKNIDGTWFLSTPFTYPIPHAFITGVADVPKLNIDSRTLFKIHKNFEVYYPEYLIRWAYLEENNLVRLHLTIIPLIENIQEKYDLLQNIIQSQQFPETWCSVFRLTELENSSFAEHTFKYLNISNVKYVNGICYLNLDEISDLNNYTYIFEKYQNQILKIYKFSLTSSLFHCINREFIERYQLRMASERDFENLCKPDLNDRQDVIILDPQILNLKLQIQPENCYFPPTDLGWSFYYNRFQLLPCYFQLPESLVIHYYCAKIIPNMWIINSYIELKINNHQDLEQISKLRQAIYSAVGTVKIVDENDIIVKSVSGKGDMKGISMKGDMKGESVKGDVESVSGKDVIGKSDVRGVDYVEKIGKNTAIYYQGEEKKKIVVRFL